MAELVQHRIHIGPPYLHATDATAYDWSVNNIGAATTFLGDGSLSTTLAAGATSLIMNLPYTLPAKGGVWVSGNGGGQSWEYIHYSTRSGALPNWTLSGLVREPATNREHNGVHNAGAIVRFWWPLIVNDGKFHLTEQIDDKLGVITWSANFSGIAFPQAALRNNHLCIIQSRNSNVGTWTNLVVGFLDSPQVADDAYMVREWSVNVVSSTVMVSKVEIDPVRSGVLDIALGSSVSASSTLASAWKEATSGDYTAAAPDLSAGKATDDDPASLWIGERAVGTEPAHNISNDPMQANIANGIIVSGVHISPATGQSAGYRWVELTAIGNQAFVGRELLFGSETASESIGLAQLFSPFNANDKVILCENSQRFNAENPNHGAKQVVDLSVLGTAAILVNRSASGGAFGIFHVEGGGAAWDSVVAWGTGTVARVVSAHTGSITTEVSPIFNPGGSITAPTAGQTIRYNWANTTTPKNNYTVSLLEMAGYPLNSGKKQWLKIDVPGMGLKLKADLTNSYTGVVTISDGSGDTTGGLPTTGTIQIGIEQIAYTAKTATTINLTSRPSGVAHVAGDAIYLVDGGIATDAAPIRQIILSRQGGTIYPKNFTIRGSRLLLGARSPDESGYTSDYHYNQAVTNNTSAIYTLTPGSTQRISEAVIEFDLMTTDPARPRLNRAQFIVDESFYDPLAWLYAGQTTAQVTKQYLVNAGLPVGAITDNGDTISIGQQSSGKSNGLALLQSMADYANLRVDCWRDSKIVIGASPFWTASGFTPTSSWHRVTSSRHEYVFANSEPIGQLVQPWKNADGTLSGTVTYPTVALFDGAIEELPEAIYASSTLALTALTRQFWLRRYPYQLIVQCAEGRPEIRPGQIVEDIWSLDPTMQPLGRRYIVVATDHMIENMTWTSTLTLREVERSQP